MALGDATGYFNEIKGQADLDLDVVDAIGCTAAVDESLKRGRSVVRLSAAWKTEFVEHGWARSVYARQPIPPGD